MAIRGIVMASFGDAASSAAQARDSIDHTQDQKASDAPTVMTRVRAPIVSPLLCLPAA